MRYLVAGAALTAALFFAGWSDGNGTPIPVRTPVLLSQVSLTYSAGECGNNACWTCKGPVYLDELDINVDTTSVRVDALKLAPGCTGYIGSLNIVTESADGIKVAEGAHDLTIGGGSVRCLDKLPTLHQDAFQAMGGSNILLSGVTLDCGRADDSLIDSNFFVNEAGSSTIPPSNIVCDGCWLGPYTAHTANIEDSVNSGVRNSVVCPGKYPRLTFTVGSGAVDPVEDGDSFPGVC